MKNQVTLVYLLLTSWRCGGDVMASAASVLDVPHELPPPVEEPLSTTVSNEEAILETGKDEVSTSSQFPEEEMEPPFDEENSTRLGMFLGSPCKLTCNDKLPHVFCDQITRHCECDKKYPVRLGDDKGCAKPVKLGDQCLHHATCMFMDQHARCKQVNHNAVCQCEPGYHTVALQRPTKKVFCAEDLVLLTTDVPTLFGVATGLAIFTALICFVLKLFSRARYSRPRHYANANLAPPILFSSETGIPLAVHGGRPSSRTSSQRSIGTYTSGYSRRPSSGGSRGILVSSSRAGAARAAAILLISCHLTATTAFMTPAKTEAPEECDEVTERNGSRRPSVTSIHSSSSSLRSYSARRFEREQREKEARQQKLHEQMRSSSEPSTINIAFVPTPSPRTPMSTDELLPSVSELKEECSSLSNNSGPSNGRSTNSSFQGELGPCSSIEILH